MTQSLTHPRRPQTTPCIDSYHHVSVKHLPAYIDELEWKYNNRRNPYLFRNTLIRLCESDVLGYQELIAS